MSIRSQRFTPNSKTIEYYSDFSLNLDFHPLTGDIARFTNEDSIKQSIKNLLLTRITERPYQPYTGSKLAGLLFEPMSPQVTSIMESVIKECIDNNEPRCNIQNIYIIADYGNDSYNITIVFNAINNTSGIELNVILKRIR